jgi:hypothetical protein
VSKLALKAAQKRLLGQIQSKIKLKKLERGHPRPASALSKKDTRAEDARAPILFCPAA